MSDIDILDKQDTALMTADVETPNACGHKVLSIQANNCSVWDWFFFESWQSSSNCVCVVP